MPLKHSFTCFCITSSCASCAENMQPLAQAIRILLDDFVYLAYFVAFLIKIRVCRQHCGGTRNVLFIFYLDCTLMKINFQMGEVRRRRGRGWGKVVQATRGVFITTLALRTPVNHLEWGITVRCQCIYSSTSRR